MLCLVGKQGCGKGHVWEIIERLIGDAPKTFSTDEPQKDVWGDNNGRMKNAFFVRIAEVSRAAFTGMIGKVRGKITDNPIRVRDLYCTAANVKNFSRFFLDTNFVFAIPDEHGERRFFIIECSEEKIGNGEYFQALRAAITDDRVVRAFYDFLKARKIKKMYLGKDIPVSVVAPSQTRSNMLPWCGNLTTKAADHFLMQAHGRRADFFSQVQRTTQPYDLTGSFARVHGPRLRAQLAVPLHSWRVAIAGDSILREFTTAFRHIAAGARVDYYEAKQAPAYLEGVDDPLGLLLKVANGEYDALVYQGPGPHYVLRNARFSRGARINVTGPLGNVKGEVASPSGHHRALVREQLERLKCVGAVAGVPVAFFGMLPIEGRVLLLDPPKFDYDDFHPFEYSEVAAAIELEEARHPQWARSRLLFVHPWFLARQCHSVRYGLQRPYSDRRMPLCAM